MSATFDYDEKKDEEFAVHVAPGPAPGVIHDEVFGDLDGNGPNYRAVTASGAFVLMTKANVGLGILQIPFVFMSVGLIPGIILLIGMCVVITYAATMIQMFKINHPEVYSYADIGQIMFGRVGREYLTGLFIVSSVFVSASAVVAVSTALNAVSVHAACTAIFIAVAAIAGWALASIKTLGNITWLGWLGMVSILASVLTMTVAVGVQDRPSLAPQTGPWDKNFKLFANADAVTGISAVTNVLYSYSATPAYFSIISEMKDPRKFNRVLIISMTLCCMLYIVIGCIVYHYCGQYVASPALGSAGVLMKRVCYGLAIPALLVTLCIYAHLNAKFIFIRLLGGTEHLARPTTRHWVTWFACTVGTMVVAYILASAIPTFDAIVGFVGSLLSPQSAVCAFPLMWWHDNWRYRAPGQRNKLLAGINLFVFVAGLFCVVGGMYAAVTNLISTSAVNGPWTCADNSGSV